MYEELLGISPVYVAFFVFVLGTIIGSFLNVVIYRFHTKRSINQSSHCLSCQRQLRWFELFPLLSYVLLRGRCRTCGSYIPPRYFLVELATGLGFLVLLHIGGSVITLFFHAILFSLLLVIVVYDIYHFIIPNEMVVLVSGTVLVLVGYRVYDTASYFLLWQGAIGAFLTFALYAGLWKISKGRWIGFGDAKLALPLGFLVGMKGTFSLIVFSFWIGAGMSLIVMAIQMVLKRGQFGLRFFGTPLTIKSEVPFAPFLILSFVVVYFFGADVLSLLQYAM